MTPTAYARIHLALYTYPVDRVEVIRMARNLAIEVGHNQVMVADIQAAINALKFSRMTSA